MEGVGKIEWYISDNGMMATREKTLCLKIIVRIGYLENGMMAMRENSTSEIY